MKSDDNYNCFLHLKLKDFLDNERIYSIGELTDVLAGKDTECNVADMPVRSTGRYCLIVQYEKAAA